MKKELMGLNHTIAIGKNIAMKTIESDYCIFIGQDIEPGEYVKNTFIYNDPAVGRITKKINKAQWESFNSIIREASVVLPNNELILIPKERGIKGIKEYFEL